MGWHPGNLRDSGVQPEKGAQTDSACGFPTGDAWDHLAASTERLAWFAAGGGRRCPEICGAEINEAIHDSPPSPTAAPHAQL